MFGKKKVTIEPQKVEDSVLIQISAPVDIDKKTEICVPTQYKAIAIIDQKPTFRVEPCVSKRVVEFYGKEYIGKQLRIAYISTKTFAQSGWGFGNIQVNNERIREAYRVGANGKYSIDIVDYAKTIQAFPNIDLITMDLIRERTLSIIKTIGVPILADYFTNTNTSIFEISSLLNDFRSNFVEQLKGEKTFAQMGISINTLTVDGFHVNEDDLELIRNRINEQGEAK